jgi:membrane associated rhomboid family serine protease
VFRAQAGQIPAMPQREPALNIPPAVLGISAILIFVHAVRWALGPEIDEWILLAFSFIPARYGEAADFLPGGQGARFWSPLSYSLLHADLVHLTVNLVWMASFGSAVARRFGSSRFLLLWALTSMGGAAAQALAHPNDEMIVIGASGAVSGLTAAAARFAFAERGPLGQAGGYRVSYLIPALSLAATFANRRALSFILLWFGMNLLFGIAGGALMGVEGEIAWQAHIGGFLVGLLAFSLLDPVRPDPVHLTRGPTEQVKTDKEP